jgi:hypothetical protein
MAHAARFNRLSMLYLARGAGKKTYARPVSPKAFAKDKAGNHDNEDTNNFRLHRHHNAHHHEHPHHHDEWHRTSSHH